MEDKEVVLRRAKNAVIARDFNLAIRLYKSLLQEDVKNLEYLNALGNLYMKAGDDQKALLYFQQILTFYPENFESMNACGGIYRRMGKFNESIAILQKAQETGINPAQVSYNLGFTYKLMGNDEDAIECFENVINENPTDVLAYNHLGTIYAAEKDHAKAVATYKRGLQIDPNHPILQFNMAKSLQEMHDDGSAIQAYETALRAKPGWQDAVIAYSEMLLGHRKTKMAGELVQNAIGLHPQDGGLYVQLGRVMMKQNNYEKAASAFETANRLAAKNSDTLREMAVAYEKLNRLPEAADSINQAKKLNGENLDIQKAEISILLSSKNYAGAGTAIKQMAGKAANDPELYDLAGQYSILIGKDAALKGYEDKIKKIDPEYIAHLYSFATRYAEKGNYVEAKARVKAFIDEKMKDVPAWILLGQIDEALGNPTDALDDYSTAVAFDPNNFLAGKLAKTLGEKIDSEVNKMEDSNSGTEIAGAEEISLDEFDFGSDDDASIVPDEEISEPVVHVEDGLSAENDADILNMDSQNSLFESAEEDNGLSLTEPEEPAEKAEEPAIEPEPEVEEEKTETPEQPFVVESGAGGAGNSNSSEEVPEPFEDNSDEKVDLGSLDKPEDDSFSDWGAIDPEAGNSEGGSAESAEAPDSSEETMSTMDVPLAEPTQSSPDETFSGDDIDSMLGGNDDLGETPEKTPVEVTEKPNAASTNIQIDTNKVADQAARIAEKLAESEQLLALNKKAEEAAKSAEEAMAHAEKSWMAAQNAADMVQSAEQMEKQIEKKKEEALEEIQHAARAENQYNQLMDKVSDILPRLTIAIDNPSEIEKFKKELELFKRLRQLGECLPLEQREVFLTSRVRLLLDYIISRLSGRSGLLKTATGIRRENGLPVDLNPVEAALGKGEIVEVLKKLTAVASNLDDQNLAKALIVETENVIEKL